MTDDLDSLPLAGRLKRTDFSAASRVRLSLRKRLLSGGPVGPAWTPVPARLAFGAALLLAVLLVPQRERLRDFLADSAAYAGADDPLPVLSGTFGPTPGADTRHPIVVAPVVVGPRGLSMEADGLMIVLERRAVSIKDIFERRKI